MSRPFQGVINIDIRDSVPDWAPYLQPVAPEGAPNIVYIVLDDAGFSAMEPWGGLIETPNLNKLAQNGLTYTNWHTTALCSPTRSSLLTGRNHTTNGMACIAEATSGFPNANGHIPFECATIAEVLGERGWNTHMLGKWHLVAADEMNMASTKRNWPVGRGFERYYGFLGGETNQWYPDLVYDNHPVEQPAMPEDGCHLTTDLTDLEKYKGRFDMGYERYREQVFQRQQQLGIFPEDAELSPLNPYAEEQSVDGKPWNAVDVVRPWDSLSEEEQRLFRRMAEVYAGFLSHTDHEIGRLLDFLEASGELENTIVMLVSDNGASGEGGPNGSVNENKFFNGIPDDIQENLRYLEELGSPATYNHYPVGWAWAFNTPFKMWKRYNFEGGVADPLLISWPSQIKARGELRHQFAHATDLVPTIYDCIGLELPEVVKGFPQIPLEGVSLRPTFESDDVPTPKETGFFSMLGSRAIWHKGWKAVSVHPTIAGWGNFTDDRWELYHTDKDPTESHDLAAEHPVKLQELISLWFHEAGRYRGLPLEDRTAVEILADPTRPQVAPPPGPVRLLPGRGRGAGDGRGQHPQSQLQRRRRGGRRVRGRRRGAVLPRGPLRRPRPVRQGPQAQVRLQLRRQQRADGRVHQGGPDRPGAAVGRLREGGRRHAHHRDAVAVHQRGESRRGPDHDPAGQLLPGRRGTERGQGPRRAGHRRLPGRQPVPLHRRHHRQGDRRRLGRAVHRPREGGHRHDGPRRAVPADAARSPLDANVPIPHSWNGLTWNVPSMAGNTGGEGRWLARRC